MSPQEKAKEFVEKMYNADDPMGKYPMCFDTAKQWALIAVDEILKSNPIIPLQFMLESEALDAAREYWQQVKTEIEKL